MHIYKSISTSLNPNGIKFYINRKLFPLTIHAIIFDAHTIKLKVKVVKQLCLCLQCSL